MRCVSVDQPAVSSFQQSQQDADLLPRQNPQTSSQDVLHDTAIPLTEDIAVSASNVGADLSIEWVKVTARHRPASRSTPMPAIRVKGSRENVSLKSVPRKHILSAFVGRILSDTLTI